MTDDAISVLRDKAQIVKEMTGGDWAYRPFEQDDWGIVRGSPDPDGVRWPVATARAGCRMAPEEIERMRKLGADPHRTVGNYLVAAQPSRVLALIAMLEASEDALKAAKLENAELRARLESAPA